MVEGFFFNFFSVSGISIYNSLHSPKFSQAIANRFKFLQQYQGALLNRINLTVAVAMEFAVESPVQCEALCLAASNLSLLAEWKLECCCHQP